MEKHWELFQLKVHSSALPIAGQAHLHTIKVTDADEDHPDIGDDHGDHGDDHCDDDNVTKVMTMLILMLFQKTLKVFSASAVTNCDTEVSQTPNVHNEESFQNIWNPDSG